jgi:branched-chain amino acid transport system ATP-binding protein
VRLGIAYVPEGRGVLSSLTIDDNLSLAASVVPAGQRVARNKVYDMLPTLAKLRNRKAGALSGGELQLLALGRAIVVGPALILLDEPAMGLSPVSKDLVLACVTNLRAMGTGVLVAEQDIFLVRTSTEQCVILSLGRSVKDGATQECLGTMALKDAYLGPANRKHAL